MVATPPFHIGYEELGHTAFRTFIPGGLPVEPGLAGQHGICCHAQHRRASWNAAACWSRWSRRTATRAPPSSRASAVTTFTQSELKCV